MANGTWRLSFFDKQFKVLQGHNELLFATAVISVIFMLMLPVSSMIIDMLLSLSITFSVIILITVLFIQHPLEFNSFPSVLLLVTMLRLALNIASTRLILLNGHRGTAAAGYVIESFGRFVMQNSVMVGLIVFIILTIINFIVITKGSGRIAEVSARFSLDAMPGKQMAIDADLSAGIITDLEAQKRRRTLEEESAFFGAMDGASKFVRGDAIAGIMITFTNFIAGMVIGIVEKNMDFSHAVQTYTLLTIGDGLVSQIPSLIISVSAGLIVTKSGVLGSTEKAIFYQLGRHPKALLLTSIMTLIIGSLPGMPFGPFFITSLASMGLSYTSFRRNNPTALPSDTADDKVKPIEVQQMGVDDITIELGAEILACASEQYTNNLTKQVATLKNRLSKELGFIIPTIRIKDNLTLPHTRYVIKIKEVTCASNDSFLNKLLALPSADSPAIFGNKVIEPVFGLPAVWIDLNQKSEAIEKCYTIIEPTTVIVTHLTEVIKDNIAELVSYSSVQYLLEHIKEEHKKFIADIVPTQVGIGIIQKILQNLLAEGISIRDLTTIIEAIVDANRINQDPSYITEHVRQRLSRQICAQLTSENGYIPVITISSTWEKIFSDGIKGEQSLVTPSKLQEFVNTAQQVYEQCLKTEENTVILAANHHRSYIKTIIKELGKSMPVLAQGEIHHRSKIKHVGTIN